MRQKIIQFFIHKLQKPKFNHHFYVLTFDHLIPGGSVEFKVALSHDKQSCNDFSKMKSKIIDVIKATSHKAFFESTDASQHSIEFVGKEVVTGFEFDVLQYQLPRHRFTMDYEHKHKVF